MLVLKGLEDYTNFVMPKKKTKSNAWFRKVRSSYLPSSWQGMIIYLCYVVYIVAVPVTWYQRGHELWTLLAGVIPLLVLALFITQYVASKHAK